jgi:sugar lactone lactonase YvrE
LHDDGRGSGPRDGRSWVITGGDQCACIRFASPQSSDISGAGGIWILDPQGKKLGRIVHGQPATTNIGFGGDDWKTLYFTSRTHLGAVNVKIAGIPVPTPKKS